MKADDGADEKLTAFEQRTRELLRDSAEGLDAGTRSRLTQARAAAMEQAHGHRTSSVWKIWVPAGSLAGAATLAIVLWSGRTDVQQPSAIVAGPPPLEDLEILVASESFDLLEELEFYVWVEEMPVADGTDIG